METKSAFIRARIEPTLKKKAEHIFSALGINTTQVIHMLYKYVEREKAIPFDLAIPNKETAKAIKEARAGRGIVTCKDVDDLFNKLGINDADSDIQK